MGKRKNTNIQTIVHKTVHRKYLSVFRQEYICLCSDKYIFVCVQTRIYLFLTLGIIIVKFDLYDI